MEKTGWKKEIKNSNNAKRWQIKKDKKDERNKKRIKKDKVVLVKKLKRFFMVINILKRKIKDSIIKSSKEIKKERRRKMFNLVKDEFDENADDILNSINKMLEKNKKEKGENKKEEEK